ncbi:uncharacterized protein LOC108938206 isoform X2 [Scleropages formosus]|uniref:uncharacterized protein LOC108938206 isoform X2 n=1 Tax=Scleropages formosus TaxID=113540 RepID=UPI0010FABA7B|nr:uncharacterized protein LOC108938206 isoform X2 [Scleropages formosus]
MTKVQSLNAYVTERLMLAAREILEVVSDAVLELQEEVGRARRESERLRKRLYEVSFHAQAILHGLLQYTLIYICTTRGWNSSVTVKNGVNNTSTSLVAHPLSLPEGHLKCCSGDLAQRRVLNMH